MSRVPHSLLLLFFLMCLGACKPTTSDLAPVDLLTQGIPLKINAPTDVEVASSDLGILKDVTVKNEEGYSIQIFESEASSLDIAKIMGKMKGDIEASKFFSSMIRQEEGGFIFEKKIDENYITYDFRQVKIIGDKQYVIQAGMSGQHSLEQIEEMYDSIM